MGERTRALDWSATPLGEPAGWPQSLQTAIQIMLNSRYPMFIWWGGELINFYNDGYIPVLGKRHPEALGRAAREIWADIWDAVGPQAEAVMQRGEASWAEQMLLLMERNRFLEETYFTFSYSPLPDDHGGIGGVFCACTEDTRRVLGERRLRTLRTLAERTAQARSAEQACEMAAGALADNPHDLPFALLYLLSSDDRRLQLTARVGMDASHPAAPAELDPADAAAPWPVARVLESGQPLLVEDLPARLGALPGGAWPDSPRRAVVLPLTRAGQERLAGVAVVGLSPRLLFDDEYRGFLDLLAGHVATAVANARAYAEERRRAEMLTELDRAKTAFFSNVSHEFRTPLTLMVDADATRLGQVFGNLLNNAAKFTEPGGQIQLAVNRRDTSALVTVRDNGVGIPPASLDTVFELFTQVDQSLEKTRGGLGIGLSLARRLVEMHGGEITAHSAGSGTGSEFRVRLPLAGPAPTAVETWHDQTVTSGARRLLVVDDNRDAADSLAMLLGALGHHVRTAHDGLEGLAVATEFRPEVVLLDLGMPRLNGYDTARRLRAESWGERLLLVALTGWGQDGDRRQSREAGFDMHLVKPVEPATLEKLLATLP